MTRRGVALILVLLVLVLATTAVAGAARLAMATRTHRSVTDQARLADSLRTGAEGFIDHFLRTESPRTVLPPDAASPGVAVLDDTLEAAGIRCRITITAFDQCGMIPWGLAGRRSPLRVTLPREVAAAWDNCHDGDGSPGLDLFAVPARSSGIRAFPSPPASAQVTSSRASGSTPAIGAHLATHNPEPPALSASALMPIGLINVNTAPRPLLAAALRAAGASGLDEILASRGRGDLAPAPPTATPGQSQSIRLVSQSDCWAFRVDVSTQSIHRSWWCVYRATGSQWRCVQRVAIGE